MVNARTPTVLRDLFRAEDRPCRAGAAWPK